ncbi:MAG TPA: VOC family protein [Candidatus Polarisedimenticolia bacterium]|nr:VOC family protein [Candidatus Polarisedimenticolia bacterium]
MTTSFGLSRIGQISVNVHDLEKAVAFYRDKLGMQFLMQVPKMAFFSCGDVRLMLGIPERPEFDHPSSVIYFKVESIQGAYETMVGRGVEFVAKPHVVAPMKDYDLWMAFFRDPDANLLALMCEAPRK